MQKVITINLNGNAYQTDEAGYTALVAYLDGAERQLKDNPDRAEILADLEQAIADKCHRVLSPHKTVVTAIEVEQILREMGPVDGAGTHEQAAPGDKARTETSAPRRLYQIQDGAMLAGVCNGLAAYLRIDVTIVRIVFLVLLVVTTGGFALAYFVLAFVIPSANTSEERAAAHGQAFNAQELIDRAKKNYADFRDGRNWRRRWRREHREWKRKWREARWERWGVANVSPPQAGYATQIFAGVMVPILSLVSVAFFWIWVYAIVSLVTSHEIFDTPLPEDVPLWVGVVGLIFLYQAVAWPLHAARRTSYYALGAAHYGAIAAWDGLMSLGFGLLVVWIGFHYIPEVRDFIQALPEVVRSMRPR